MNIRFASILILLTSPFLVQAKLRLPALMTDNMVLQQQHDVQLWGWDAPGKRVQVQTSWNGKTVFSVCDGTGKWMATVHTGKAGGPYTISMKGSEDSAIVRNVALGEVWLASGQSNMEFPMAKDKGWRTGVLNFETEIPQADYPMIRMIDVPNVVSDTMRADFDGKWEVCTPQTVGNFSGVAYFFAKEIQSKTGFPVGIINSTWGGTPAESWTRREALLADPQLRSIVTEYDSVSAHWTEIHAAHKAAVALRKADTSKMKPAPREPIGPTHNKSPYKLYNGMIAPLIPYTLRGVMWYQGESNAERAIQYRRLFPSMIANWRADWKTPRLPFYFVQIAPHKSQNPWIREAQLLTYRAVPSSGMVVTTDVGDSSDIHPRNKETVGKRLSLWALQNEYGVKGLTISGPLYKGMQKKGAEIIISLDFATGLKAEGGELKDFTIAGADQQFVPAAARIEGDKIIVRSESVPEPVAVRFAWSKVPHPNLFNGAGLPASPFRTDTWSTTEVK